MTGQTKKRPRFRGADILTVSLGLIVAWSLAGAHGYQGGWLIFAIVISAGFAVGVGRRLLRLR